MTIRSKLTLLYSLILMLVVVVFSVFLYTLQSRAAFNIVERNLTAAHVRIVGQNRPLRDTNQQGRPPLQIARFNQPLVQLRGFDNSILQKSDSIGDANLPLSDAGFTSVIQGETWFERVEVEDEWFLIRSQLNQTTETTSSETNAAIVQIAFPVSSQIEYLERLRFFLLLGDFIVIVSAVGIGWFVAGLTLRPIGRITQAARLVGIERNFSRRVSHEGPNDEIGQLATTMNEMLIQLQEAYTQIGEMLQVQQRFVADASHELRTPLTTVRGNMELLQNQLSMSDEDRADIFSDTISETERLMRLVDNLLMLARADARQSLPVATIAIDPLVNDVCRQVQLLAPQQTITCQTEDDILVTANTDALKQMLLILLDNAAKHTTPETSISVSTTHNHEYVDISVQDDGPGIDATDLPHIFDRFYRGDTMRTGTNAGLGLSIVKELVEAQHGSIKVSSIKEEGSEFILSLPRSLSEETERQMAN